VPCVLLLNKDLEFVISNSVLGNWRDGRWLDSFRLLGLLRYNRYIRLYRDCIRLRCRGGPNRTGKSRKDRRSTFVGSEGRVLYLGSFNDGYVEVRILAGIANKPSGDGDISIEDMWVRIDSIDDPEEKRSRRSFPEGVEWRPRISLATNLDSSLHGRKNGDSMPELRQETPSHMPKPDFWSIGVAG
jgi:hypothetical protein